MGLRRLSGAQEHYHAGHDDEDGHPALQGHPFTKEELPDQRDEHVAEAVERHDLRELLAAVQVEAEEQEEEDQRTAGPEAPFGDQEPELAGARPAAECEAPDVHERRPEKVGAGQPAGDGCQDEEQHTLHDDQRTPRLAELPGPDAKQSITRAFVLVLVAIALGLGGLYLVRAALVDVGGIRIGSAAALPHLWELVQDWRFWAGGVLILVILLISLELYGSEELSKVVPLYSLSYVVVAVIGLVFLDERVTLQRWIGILAIITGVVVVLRS
jgi:hypothetical protein